jgi:two-component system phosphate regulon sensor histidine kinase PhoR
MNALLVILLGIALVLAAWFAWRYASLRRRVDEYARLVRRNPDRLPTDKKDLEDLSNAIVLQRSTFEARHETLNAQNARLATVLEQMPDGVLIVDSQGQIQFANPAAGRLFEYPDAIGHSVVEVVRNHQLVEAWKRCQASRELQSESVELPARRRYLQLIAIPDQHAGGSLLLVQDLTRVRRLETVRRDFISNVSHELRTPLASLKALTDTLQNGALQDSEAGPRFLDRIVTEVDALIQMAQELLDLSRIESGQGELVLASVSPRALLVSAADRMRLQAERAGLKLTVRYDDQLPDLRADKRRLEQVLVNLIHNAVKFTRSGGEVVISAEISEGGVRFAVRDTGIGIPADDLPRIFERFYKSDRSRAGGGTGLGLSIAKHIVEAHGGRVWVESLEGEGSTFYFSLPTA